MKLELSDLLQDAKTGAPPARYDIDDAVAAGRRLQNRHRVAWASAATVAAVAAAAVVPQVLVDRDAPAPAPAIPAAQAPAAGPVVYPTRPFQYAFKGYTVGRYQVTDPVVVTASFQQADVRIAGELIRVKDSSGGPDITGPANALQLTVFRPGVFDPVRYLKVKAQSVTVNGRRGWFSTNLPIDQSPELKGMEWPALAWQYADNAWAALDNVSPAEHGKADLLKIAQGLHGSPPYPAKIVFQTTYLPDGYRLTSGGREADWPYGAGAFQATGTRYVNGPDQDIRELVTPIIDSDNNGVRDMRINVYRRDWADNGTPPPGLPEGGVWCNKGNSKLCYRITPDGGWLAEVEGSGDESPAELVKIMAGLRFADVDDPSTWFPMG